MRSIPIDNSRLLSVKYLGTNPSLDFETKEPKRNSDGVPIYEVQVVIASEGFGGAEENELLKVKIAAVQPPRVGPLDEMEFVNFVARAWSNNGKSGISFSADGIKAVGAQVSDNK
jgi:hypothetical protein